MPTNPSKTDDPKFERAYYRAMLRSAFVSLFWAVISDRKKTGLTLVSVAKAIGSSKHEVSRWFKGDPNWTLNTIAAIAHALKLTLRVYAVDEYGNFYGTGGQYVPSRMPIPTSSVSHTPVRITRKPPGADEKSAITSSDDKAA